jgi:transcriptional regulator with PAS, ATPase and Fis domain
MPSATIFPLISNLADPASLAVKAAVEKVAAVNTPVLLWGETGSGKDFWAAFLAALSPFQPLLNLGCGDVPETLLESEWFGYQKGAFSGADSDAPGKWRQAGPGTIFLNQIDLLSLNLQAKLLRAIERKKICPLGAVAEVDIPARFLFSADAAIEDKVRRGEFRADLYYRISTVSIFIPPLRQRPGDILPLLHFFCSSQGVPVALSDKARQRLLQYPWPGNIRELENFVNGLAVRGAALDDQGVWTLLDRPGPILDLIQAGERTLAEVEAEYTAYLLRKYRNKSQVARMLGISRKSLYNKLKRHENH